MRKWILGTLLLVLCFLCGCGTDEVENNAFPMAVGIELNDENDFQIYMAYPNLQSQDAKDNALTSDVFWSGSAEDLFAGADEMSENSNKNVDFNHLKVLVLDAGILKDEQAKEELISFFMENKDAAWNTYVMLSNGKLKDLFSDELEIGSSLGIYLEDMIEEWTNIRSGARVTVGDFMSQYFNGNETDLVPVVSVEKKLPTVQSFALVKRLNCVLALTQEAAYETMMVRNQLKAFSFSTEDDVRMSMHLISVEKELTEMENPKMPEETLPLLTVKVKAVAQTQNRLRLSEADKKEVRRQAELELENRLLFLANSMKQAYHVDVADSFLLLPGYHRELWRVYRSNADAYEKKLQYRIQVDLSPDEKTV